MPPDARQKMIGQFAAKNRAAKKRGDTRTYHSEDPAVARKILYGKGSFNAQVKGAEKLGKKVVKKLNPFD